MNERLTRNQTADMGKCISIQEYQLVNEGQNIATPNNLKYSDSEYQQLLTSQRDNQILCTFLMLTDAPTVTYSVAKVNTPDQAPKAVLSNRTF